MKDSLKILFVEDVFTDAEIIWHELKKSDISFKKLLVDNKKDFLDGLNSFEPDIIISDYSLPQFDGMAALQLRNQLAPLIPFILVTGSLNEEVAVNCMKTGADDYILKDNLSRLGLAITNSINKAKLHEEKKVAEEELQKSEQRLKKAQAIAHIGNWELYLSTKIIWSSDEAMKIYGLFNESHEFPLNLISEIALPEYRGILNETLDNLLKYNESYEVEFKIKRANDGAVRWVYSKAELVLENGDEQVKIIGVVQDITESKQLKEAIEENEEIFRNFMEYSPIYVFFKDENIRPIRLSRNYESLLGMPSSECLGKTMDELFPSELAKSMVADDKKVLKEGEVVTVEEELNGRFFSTIKFPIKVKGKPSYLAGYTIDITAHKLAETAIHESEEKYRSIFENVQDLYYESLIDGTILEVSPSILNLSKGQYNREDLIGKSMYELYSAPKDREKLLDELKSKGSISDYELKLRNKDGSLIPCSISSRISFDMNGVPLKIIGSIRDITMRKKAEEALVQSKKEFQNYFESGSVGMSVTLPDKRWIEVNQKLCQMFGYSKEELLGMNWVDLSHPDDRVKNLELFQKALEVKIDNYELEKRFVCKDGKIIYVTLSVVCERNHDGTANHFLSSYIDVTERVLAEEKIQYERIMLRTLIDNLPDLIYVKDIKGRKLISNIADVRSMGFTSEEEVIGKTDLVLFPGEYGHRGHSDDMKVIKSGKAIVGREENFVDGSRQNRWLLTTKVPLRDINGIIIGLVGIGHDITSRKKAEEDLLQSYLFNESLLKTIPFGMDIVDETGTILFQSDNFIRLFGESAVGNKCWELYRDDKKQCPDCPLFKGIAIGETEAYESHGVLGNRIFEINHTGMMYQGKKAMLEIFQDITDRKLSEVELILAKNKAEESDKLKTAFLHNISHEIRTPMNAIVGFAALLGEPDIDTKTSRDYVEVIMQSSNHLLEIITDIVDISNIEANLVKVVKSEINVNSALNSLCNQFVTKANEKKIHLICETALSDSDALILTDNTKLTQILSNLIINALKFTDKGHVKVIARLKDNFLEFCVSDTGIGIAQELQYRIFERFYQVQHSVSRLYEGTGLGLAISKAHVELMGGKIWVNSESGKGSKFFFKIPYEKQIVENPVEKEKVNPGYFVFPEKKKILVAEDIESNFKLICYFLSGANIEVIRAANGKEAVDKCLSVPDIDLVLMGIKMPVMDGYTAVKLIREKNASIPIIAQTAYIDDQEIAMESGCSAFISKPFDKRGLLEIIHKSI
jgi:PAS domain S-box-containing protein